jgi:hypothetical protein
MKPASTDESNRTRFFVGSVRGLLKEITMTVRSTTLICLVVWNSISLHSLAQSPTTETVNEYDQRITELETSLAELRHSIYHKSENLCNYKPWSAGFSFLFTKLHYKESFQAIVADLGTGTQNLIPFNNDHELTPRVFLGYQNKCGLGVRGTFWNFQHSSRPFNSINNGVQIPSATSTSVIFPALIVAPFLGDQLTVNQSLKAASVDLEATYEFRIRRLQGNIGGGLRYAHSDQHFDARVTPGLIPGAAPATLNWRREFEGIGPLLSAHGRLPLGSSGLYGTGAVNASFLFGDKNLTRTVTNDATLPPNLGLPVLAMLDSNEITGVYGTSFGTGWQRETRFGRTFIETAYEGQLWTDGGAPTMTFAGFNGFSLTFGIIR